MIDKKLLLDFLGEVSTNKLCHYKYKNNQNRNQWNCIYSAMDWIEVSADYIISHPLSSIKDHQSIELYSYLSCVDIIVEAIEQLHRVIYATNDCIFEKDKECFVDNPFEQDDRTYFKTLRACFGAHPVNLEDPEDRNNKQARRFASWSGGYFGSDDFSVILYSNKVGGKYISLGMRFKQIDAYLEKYYNHLIKLKDELRKQYDGFCKKMRKQKIAYSDNSVEQLIILQKENKKRLNNDYYEITIDELLMLIQTPISCNKNRTMVSMYRKYLESTVRELYSKMQNMDFSDLEFDPLVEPCMATLPNGWHYGFEKLSDTVHGVDYDDTLWIGFLEKAFEDKFEFQFESPQELYVLVHASLFLMSSKEN